MPETRTFRSTVEGSVEENSISDTTGLRRLTLQDIPTECLSRVFIHTLPVDSLSHMQPDVTIAPMVLCQVCAYWRALALAQSELWKRLYHIMWMTIILNDRTNQKSVDIDSKDMEFLRWWKGNMRQSKALLRLEANFEAKVRRTGGPGSNQDDTKDDDQRAFIIQLLSSAQYLDMSKGMSAAVNLYVSRGRINDMNLDTFILRDEDELRIFARESILFELGVVPFEPAHPIRRIILDNLSICKADVSSVCWSNMTHVTLLNMPTSIPGWLALTREFLSLQYGRFDIDDYLEDFKFKQPPFTELLHLRQLIIRSSFTDLDEYLLRNLHLPVLTSLRLETTMTGRQLQAALSSTPSLKELHLGRTIPQNPITEQRSVFQENIETLTARIPALQRLLLCVDSEEISDFKTWLGRLLKSEWIHLGRNNIKEIEFTLDRAPTNLKKRQELREILQEQSVDGVDLILTPDKLSVWNKRFDIPAGEVDVFFEDLMFKEV
ncbi:hypothetical protein GALMADRAFT_275572 [Galerina marginata CBS 339.88]|uniref:Uncharacterized protein n=1 Tax=Galerina marginata (strain CBS 339.88) TaxID=685588 RepID=A0A067U033_GALM3|nr:hypothetical protein GALMADRAFT_275572 [Galerina marginata CBS 339.88]